MAEAIALSNMTSRMGSKVAAHLITVDIVGIYRLDAGGVDHIRYMYLRGSVDNSAVRASACMNNVSESRALPSLHV